MNKVHDVFWEVRLWVKGKTKTVIMVTVDWSSVTTTDAELRFFNVCNTPTLLNSMNICSTKPTLWEQTLLDFDFLDFSETPRYDGHKQTGNFGHSLLEKRGRLELSRSNTAQQHTPMLRSRFMTAGACITIWTLRSLTAYRCTYCLVHVKASAETVDSRWKIKNS